MNKPTKPKEPPKNGKDTIYVDVDDEISAIIDKVEVAKKNVVALVLPKRATTLQSIVNMRLLKRSAAAAGKNVVLITSESGLLPLAGAVGLRVAKNLQSKPAIPPPPQDRAELESEATIETDAKPPDDEVKLDHSMPIGELAIKHAYDETETIALDNEDDSPVHAAKKTAKPKKDRKLAVPNFDRFRLLVGAGVLGLILLIVFLVLAIKVLPKAKIALQTTSLPVSVNLALNTSDSAKELDTAKNIIPAVLKTTDQTSQQQIPATGQQNNGTKASGSVTLKNCSDSSITVPAGTGLSAGGLTFITQKSTSLGSGNFDSGQNCKSTGNHIDSVNVNSQSPGAKYNIGPSNFTVAGFSSVSGSSSSTMSGGTDNIITIVAQQDLDAARQKITSGDSDKFSKTFQDQFKKEDLYLLESTLKLSDPKTTATPDVGQPAATTTVTVKITYSVLTVKRSDLEKAINEALSKQVDTKKQKLSTTDVVKNATVTVQNQSSPTAMVLNITENTTAVPIIDVEAIKKQTIGLESGKIRETLGRLPGVKSVEVKYSPFWVSTVPKNTSKITVVQQEVKK